jgi:DNA-binding NtrC family response regulator
MTRKPQILIADDEQNIRRVLEAILRRAGFRTQSVGDGQAALEALRAGGEEGFAALVTDLKMPKMDGMELLRRVKEEREELPVVMITAHGSVDSAVEAVKLGAFDYVEKPFEDKAIRSIVTKAVAHYEAAADRARALPADDTENGRFGLIGTGASMQEIFSIIDRVADTPSTVLITGESGTGKELVAKALHSQSSRHEQPLIKINCAAIPETLIESELFGHEKGAFTGAVSAKPGRFELAHKGTLLLDEVGEIPAPMQVKLLRVLQESEFERVGGIKTISVDVRLITATNADLARATEQGTFREDLYYRLNVVPIRIPPLRERQEDIPLLVRHFMRRFNEKLGKSTEGLSDEAMALLRRHPWPGNIRELENLLERTVLFTDHAVIQVSDLPPDLIRVSPSAAPPLGANGAAAEPGAEIGVEGVAVTGPVAAPSVDDRGLPQSAGDEPGSQPLAGSLKEAVKAETVRVEREMIVRALDETGGNVTRAAKLLQISRKSLQIKMKELGLRRGDEPGPGSGLGPTHPDEDPPG